MPAVVGELHACDELRVSVHDGHALAREVVVYGEGLVRAGGGRVQTGAIQAHLDEGAVVAAGTLERSAGAIRGRLKTLQCLDVIIKLSARK